MPDTEVSTDMAETMSPIEQTYRFYTQHFSEKEIQPLVETVLGMIVQLDKDEQKDESTRKQILDEMRGALDAVLKNHHGSSPKGPTCTSISSDVFKLLSSNLAALHEKLLLLFTILKTHWQASYHIDSIQTAQYPWLSCFMASGYWIALAIYFGFFAWSVYRWCMSDIRLFGKPVSVVLLDPLLIIITLAVPYTLGRGKRFPTLMVLVLWVALGSVRKAMF